MSAPEGYVIWAESGRVQKIRRDCLLCVPSGQLRFGDYVVSPRGLVHLCLRGETRTLCGKVADGDAWWWAE